MPLILEYEEPWKGKPRQWNKYFDIKHGEGKYQHEEAYVITVVNFTDPFSLFLTHQGIHARLWRKIGSWREANLTLNSGTKKMNK